MRQTVFRQVPGRAELFRSWLSRRLEVLRHFDQFSVGDLTLRNRPLPHRQQVFLSFHQQRVLLPHVLDDVAGVRAGKRTKQAFDHLPSGLFRC